MITLRLHDIESTHGMLDILHYNGYKYANNLTLDLNIIKDDISNVFEFPQNTKMGESIYFIELDDEDKIFKIYSKWVDINYIRNQKLKQLNLW